MVATPMANVVVGRAELAAYREEPDLQSPSDERMVAAVVEAEAPIAAFVFSTSNEGAAWTFDPSLEAAEREQLGYHVVRGQLGFYRGLFRAGVSLCMGAAMGESERSAMRLGTQRLLEEREAPGSASSAALDTWLLRNFTFFTSASLDWVFAGTLVDKLPLCETRADRKRANA